MTRLGAHTQGPTAPEAPLTIHRVTPPTHTPNDARICVLHPSIHPSTHPPTQTGGVLLNAQENAPGERRERLPLWRLPSIRSLTPSSDPPADTKRRTRNRCAPLTTPSRHKSLPAHPNTSHKATSSTPPPPTPGTSHGLALYTPTHTHNSTIQRNALGMLLKPSRLANNLDNSRSRRGIDTQLPTIRKRNGTMNHVVLRRWPHNTQHATHRNQHTQARVQALPLCTRA